MKTFSNYVSFRCIGEPCSVKLGNLIINHVRQTCRIWNLYGPAEATIGSTLFLIDKIDELDDIPMGKPIRNYLCIVRDNFGQDVIIDQEGELLVGGVGVFAGYLDRV